MLELSWPKRRGFGSWIGGICGFFGRYTESAGAYFYASPDSVHIQVFSAIRERLGEVEIPTDYSNIVAMRDRLNWVIKRLDEIAEATALTIIQEQPGLGPGQLSKLSTDENLRNRQRYLDRLDDAAIREACERLHDAGYIERRFEKVSLGDGRSLYSYYPTTTGTLRLAELIQVTE